MTIYRLSNLAYVTSGTHGKGKGDRLASGPAEGGGLVATHSLAFGDQFPPSPFISGNVYQVKTRFTHHS